MLLLNGLMNYILTLQYVLSRSPIRTLQPLVTCRHERLDIWFCQVEASQLESCLLRAQKKFLNRRCVGYTFMCACVLVHTWLLYLGSFQVMSAAINCFLTAYISMHALEYIDQEVIKSVKALLLKRLPQTRDNTRRNQTAIWGEYEKVEDIKLPSCCSWKLKILGCPR